MSARKLFVFAVLGLITCAQPALAARLAQDALDEARQRGSARVLVMLETPAKATPAPASGARAWANLRLLTARQRADSVLMSLPQRGNRVHHRLEPLSLIAMDADAATLERLRTHPLVQRVDLDRRMKKMAGPDPALTLTRVSDLLSVGLDGAGMKAAVIDTGVDTDHTEFVWRLTDQACFCTVENGSGGCCPNGQAHQVGTGAAEDRDGHGTHVASVLLGNGLAAPQGGVRAAQLVAVRVFDDNGESCCASDVLAAMDWVATHHPDVAVINLSLGTEDLYPNHCDAVDAYTLATQALVARLAAQGTMVVAAAGNDGNIGAMSAPACISNVMSVGATYSGNFGSISYTDSCTDANTYSMLITCFSNRSATTDIFAPGAVVQGARLGGGATYMAGTSQATPVVAACAVALREAAPQSTVAQRMDAMTLSPTRISDARTGRGYPFLDCRDAVRLLNPAYFGPKRVHGSEPLIPGYSDNQVAMPVAPQPFSRAPVKERPRLAPRVRETP